MREEKFLQALTSMGLTQKENIYKKFEIYTNYMLAYNEKVNLTSILKREDIYVKHYLDSLSILKYCPIEKNAKTIDIGVGAGFPSIPVKLLREDLNMVLVDSLNKRITFLQNLIEKLQLSSILPVHARAEDLARNKEFRESFDICMSRAVASLPILLEYCSPFVKVGGSLLCLKGQNVGEEILLAKNALKKLHCKIEDVIDIDLPFSDLQHKIVSIKKIAPTPQTYPRKAGNVTKKPL